MGRAAVDDALAGAPAPGADGLRTLTLAVESEEVAYGQLMSLGPELEVLAPGTLRARFAEAAEGLRALYR